MVVGLVLVPLLVIVELLIVIVELLIVFELIVVELVRAGGSSVLGLRVEG